MRRVVVIILGLSAAAGLSWLMLKPQPVAVDVAAVRRGSLQLTVTDDGRTRIREKYIVSAPLGGRLVRIDLAPGDPVHAGETILAVIQPTDPTLLDPRALAEAQARVQAAEVRVSQLSPRRKLAEEKLKFAETELGRFSALAAKSASTASALESAKLAFDSANTEYGDVLFAQEIAEFELQLAKAAFIHTDDQVESGRKDFQLPIKSPINGNVLRVLQESATIVTPGTPLLEIGDPADLEVEMDVLSSDAVRIRPGAAVSLKNWGGEQPLAARVRLVEPSAFTRVSALGIEEQRVNVIIDFIDQDQQARLGDGYRVEAEVVIWQNDDVLKVPAGALFRSGTDWAVFISRDGHAERSPVTLDHRNDTEAEVIDGLTDGDLVILHPGDQLQDRSLLRIRKPDE